VNVVVHVAEALAAVLVLAGYARYRRVRWLTEQAFIHVKALIAAEQHEAYKALRRRYHAQQRNRLRGAGQDSGVHQAGVVRLADPRRHVRLKIDRVPWPAVRHVQAVTVRWTPLVPYPSADWLAKLAEAVAHFLAIDVAGVERTRLSMRRKRVTFVRRAGSTVPDHLPLEPLPDEDVADAG